MIDFDKFKYRVGDKVRKLVYAPTEVRPTEYEIIAIEESDSMGRLTRGSRSYNDYRHYKLKNLSPGCLDKPQWVPQNLVHSQYESCNPAIKLLYKKNELASGVLTAETIEEAYKKAMLFGTGKLLINTTRQSGKSWLYQQFLQNEANRAELAKPDSHSLDALRYLVFGQPPKKVSR